MTYLKPQTARGGFTLITLILAGTAIGRVLGFGFDEALYIATLFLIVSAWALNLYRLHQAPEPSDGMAEVDR